jgi:phenylacetate-CoA ligase
MSRAFTDWSRLKSDIHGVEWPPISVNPAASLQALVRYLEETQWLSPAELEAHQFRQLRVLAAHCQKQSARFRRRLEDAALAIDDLGSPAGLSRLPRLRRRELQAGGAELFCAETPAQHLPVRESRTSGSTGEPVVVRRTVISQLFWLAMTMRDHLWHQDDYGARFASIRPTFSAYAELPDWGEPSRLLFHTGPGLGMPVTAAPQQYVDWIGNFQPNILLSFPSIIDAISQHCARNEIRMPRFTSIKTVGETLHPEVRRRAEALFSVRIRDIYSSFEAGTVALQCPESDLYHVMAESLIVEVVDEAGRPCKDGEVGRIVITDLHNFATPLIRYDIGDYAEVGGACACGRGLPTLRRILGRERNLILMPDGTRRYPLVGFTKFREVAPIMQYQFIQHDRRDLEARFVSEAPLTAKQESDLGAVILKALGATFDLRFTYFPDQIPRSASGKYEEFICRIPVQGP